MIDAPGKAKDRTKTKSMLMSPVEDRGRTVTNLQYTTLLAKGT